MQQRLCQGIDKPAGMLYATHEQQNVKILTKSVITDLHITIMTQVTILFPPRMKIVTALEFWQPSITSILSFVVPKVSSRTIPACPSLSAVNSLNRGTIRPPVAIAISCNSQHKNYSGDRKLTSTSKYQDSYILTTDAYSKTGC